MLLPYVRLGTFSLKFCKPIYRKGVSINSLMTKNVSFCAGMCMDELRSLIHVKIPGGDQTARPWSPTMS